jgi:hypothetical protein
LLDPSLHLEPLAFATAPAVTEAIHSECSADGFSRRSCLRYFLQLTVTGVPSSSAIGHLRSRNTCPKTTFTANSLHNLRFDVYDLDSALFHFSVLEDRHTTSTISRLSKSLIRLRRICDTERYQELKSAQDASKSHDGIPGYSVRFV